MINKQALVAIKLKKYKKLPYKNESANETLMRQKHLTKQRAQKWECIGSPLSTWSVWLIFKLWYIFNRKKNQIYRFRQLEFSKELKREKYSINI